MIKRLKWPKTHPTLSLRKAEVRGSIPLISTSLQSQFTENATKTVSLNRS